MLLLSLYAPACAWKEEERGRERDARSVATRGTAVPFHHYLATLMAITIEPGLAVGVHTASPRVGAQHAAVPPVVLEVDMGS